MALIHIPGVSLFKKTESISNMEEVFVALHADNEDVRFMSVMCLYAFLVPSVALFLKSKIRPQQRNIASAMSAYPIGQQVRFVQTADTSTGFAVSVTNVATL